MCYLFQQTVFVYNIANAKQYSAYDSPNSHKCTGLTHKHYKNKLSVKYVERILKSNTVLQVPLLLFTQ